MLPSHHFLYFSFLGNFIITGSVQPITVSHLDGMLDFRLLAQTLMLLNLNWSSAIHPQCESLGFSSILFHYSRILTAIHHHGLKGKALHLSFSCPVMSNSLRLHGLQDTRPPCPSPYPRVYPSSCSLHRWYHPAISSSDALFSFSPQYFPASGTFPISWPFASDDQNTTASASASVFPKSIQGWFLYDWIVWSPCCPRSSQESSLASQFKSINSLALCLLHSPALTTIHDHWEDHSLDYTDLCQQSDVSAF